MKYARGPLRMGSPGRHRVLGRRDERPGLEEIALPHIDFLYRFALWLSREPALAEALVQDTMLNGLRAWRTFRSGSNVRAWLATLLRNTFTAGQRRRNRQLEVIENELMDRLALTTAEPAGPVSGSFDRFTDDEIGAAIDALPQRFREALVLSDIEDLTLADIAAITDVPVRTVRCRLVRARRFLQGLLGAYALEQGYERTAKETTPPPRPAPVDGSPARTNGGRAVRREPYEGVPASIPNGRVAPLTQGVPA